MSTDVALEEPTQEQAPLTRWRRLRAARPFGPLAGALLIVLLGAVALSLGLLIGSGGEAREASPASASANLGAAADSGSAPLDFSLPTESPNVDWQTVQMPRGTVYLPFSVDGENGPTSVGANDRQWVGWPQTPKGALLAGWTLSMLLGGTETNDLDNPYLSSYVLATPEMRATIADHRPEQAPLVTVIPLGFEVMSYTPTKTQLRYAQEWSIPGGGGQQDDVLTVVWQDGDWRLDYGAQNRPRSQELNPEWQFTPWGP